MIAATFTRSPHRPLTPSSSPRRPKLLRQPAHNPHRLQTHPHDLAHQADDVFGVVGPVGVAGDAGAFVGFDAVLVDDSFDGTAVAARRALFEMCRPFGTHHAERDGYSRGQCRGVDAKRCVHPARRKHTHPHAKNAAANATSTPHDFNTGSRAGCSVDSSS